MKYKINRGVRKLLNPNNLKKKKKSKSDDEKEKNNELQRIMVISFSKEIPIHHEPMITFIVTTSILFFFSHRHIDRSPRSYHRPTTKLKLTRTSRNFIRRSSLRDRKRRHSRKGFSLIKPREREEGREREREPNSADGRGRGK